MESTNEPNSAVEWHTAILPRQTRKALDFFATQNWLKKSSWYLAGGTAFALYEGHRTSLDLDFFLQKKNFDTQRLLANLREDVWFTDIAREGTVYGRLLDAKVSFIAYPFFVPKQLPRWYGSVRILQPRDIAVMKIIAVSQRGRKRDFVDLYWYVKKHEPLADVLRRLPDQYPTVAHNYHHILKSLMYFADAEEDPMPKVFFKTTWREIKAYFTREVPKITKEFLQLFL